MRHFSVATLFIASLILAGCSSSSDTTPPSFNGKWVIFLNSATEFPPATEFDMNLQRSGDMLSSDNVNTIDNIGCVSPEDTLGDITQGNIKGNQFFLGLAIDNGTPNAQGIRFTGTVSKNRASVTGTFESDPGICFEGKTGIFTASFIAPLTGDFAGSLIDTNTSATSNVTGTLTEDMNLNESASLVVANNACFSTLTTSPTDSGFSIGRLTDFEVTDGTNVVDFLGGVTAQAESFIGTWNVIAGCNNQFGTMNLEVVEPHANRTSADFPANHATVDRVLSERFKLLLAARRRHA